MSREKRNAVGLKSGIAVSHSAPVLRQPTSPQTAGLKPEASLSSAKSGQEFEGSALIGGAAAVPFSSLDKIQTNRDAVPESGSIPIAKRCGVTNSRKVFANRNAGLSKGGRKVD